MVWVKVTTKVYGKIITTNSHVKLGLGSGV